MKPSFTPCRSRKLSLCRRRNSITADMSASLKVVSRAACCWAWTSLRAMTFRSGDMGTRSSVGPRVGSGGGEAAAASPKGAGGAAASTAGADSGWASLTARVASCLSTRPPGPVPCADDAGRPASPSTRRALGITRGRGSAAVAVGGVTASVSAPPALAVVGSSCLAGASPGSIKPITSPGTASSPSCFRIFTSVPAAGLGNSMAALSVSISTVTSSRAKCEPSGLRQGPIRTSVIDSPASGMINSTAMADPTP